MKKLFVYVALVIVGSTGCGSDEDFACDKNTNFKTGGEQQCAHARVTQHNQMTNYERIILAVSNSTLNFELRVTNESGAIQEDVAYSKPEATIVAPWVDLVVSTKITFTKIDRTEGKLSGKFSFEVESETGIQRASGSFSDVDF